MSARAPQCWPSLASSAGANRFSSAVAADAALRAPQAGFASQLSANRRHRFAHIARASFAAAMTNARAAGPNRAAERRSHRQGLAAAPEPGTGIAAGGALLRQEEERSRGALARTARGRRERFLERVLWRVRPGAVSLATFAELSLEGLSGTLRGTSARTGPFRPCFPAQRWRQRGLPRPRSRSRRGRAGLRVG